MPMLDTSLQNKFNNRNVPKKILCLDGGGIRGTLSLGILRKIEKEIKAKYNVSLGAYYDLICGTSTGAIIACGLAIGKSVDEMIELYLNLGGEIFGKGRRWKILPRSWTGVRAILNESYSSEVLETFLKREFGDINIGDTNKLLCGLVINTKRADTYSLWTVTNHPGGKYYEANSNLKLWELCRASAAAPYYFRPKMLKLRSRIRVDNTRQHFDATFIDGGVSLANNPAWVGFLTATVDSFGYNWNSGADNMYITSIGTGSGIKIENPSALQDLKALSWAPKLSDLFMTDALEMNQILLEGLGKNIGTGQFIDSQFDPAPNFGVQLFSFDRHNIILDKKHLNDTLGFNFNEKEIESLKQMDYYENMQTLLEIGKKYSETANFNII